MKYWLLIILNWLLVILNWLLNIEYGLDNIPEKKEIAVKKKTFWQAHPQSKNKINQLYPFLDSTTNYNILSVAEQISQNVCMCLHIMSAPQKKTKDRMMQTNHNMIVTNNKTIITTYWKSWWSQSWPDPSCCSFESFPDGLSLHFPACDTYSWN